MTVYVDHAGMSYRRMKMNHMLADTEKELHVMARKLGLKREWFQDQGHTPHYDVCLSKRQEAIALGAVEVDRCELLLIMRRLRGEGDVVRLKEAAYG